MLIKQKHSEYVKKTLVTRDIMFCLTEQDRISTLYWALNSLKILKDPYFEELKPLALKYVLGCLKEDGGFGGNPEYGSNLISTLNALQIFYILDAPYYSKDTVKYILKLQGSNGAFMRDDYGELDTRIDCCAIQSIHLLYIMRKHVTPNNKFSFEQTRALTDISSLYKDIASHIHPIAKDDIEKRIEYICNNGVLFDRTELSQPIPHEFLDEVGFNLDQTMHHLLSCNNEDGGFGQIEGSESHAAQVFCVVSSLRSLGRLESFDRNQTIDFLVYRQLPNGGFSGRVNKKEDVCYSLWAYSSLLMLGFTGIDSKKLSDFIISCQDTNGGFSDRPGNECDLYHLMFSLASLSLLGNESLGPVDPGLAI